MQSSMQQHSSSRLGRRGVAAHVLRPAAVCRVARPHREPFSSHQLVLGGTWYEDMVELLARDALSRAGASPRQHLVGIAGAPGSGKSTLSQLVCSRINELEGAVQGGVRQQALGETVWVSPAAIGVLLPYSLQGYLVMHNVATDFCRWLKSRR